MEAAISNAPTTYITFSDKNGKIKTVALNGNGSEINKEIDRTEQIISTIKPSGFKPEYDPSLTAINPPISIDEAIARYERLKEERRLEDSERAANSESEREKLYDENYKDNIGDDYKSEPRYFSSPKKAGGFGELFASSLIRQAVIAALALGIFAAVYFTADNAASDPIIKYIINAAIK